MFTSFIVAKEKNIIWELLFTVQYSGNTQGRHLSWTNLLRGKVASLWFAILLFLILFRNCKNSVVNAEFGLILNIFYYLLRNKTHLCEAGVSTAESTAAVESLKLKKSIKCNYKYKKFNVPSYWRPTTWKCTVHTEWECIRVEICFWSLRQGGGKSSLIFLKAKNEEKN